MVGCMSGNRIFNGGFITDFSFSKVGVPSRDVND